MASDLDSKGDEYLKKAEKKLKGFNIFGNKYEDAAELLEKAANQFKLAKQWDKAGATFEKLSTCHAKLDSTHEAASAYVDAANSYRKTNPKKALECMEKAVKLFTEIGRLSMAAKHYKDMAEILEKDDEIEQAMEMYERAADLYAGEEVNSTSNTCLLKVAQFAAQLEKYDRAIELFEKVATSSMDSNLLKYSVKGYLLNAGICHLATGNVEKVHFALERYQDLDPTFSGTREFKFLEDLGEALEEGEVSKFTQVVYDFDNLTRLDPWKTTLLVRAKKEVESAATKEDDIT